MKQLLIVLFIAIPCMSAMEQPEQREDQSMELLQFDGNSEPDILGLVERMLGEGMPEPVRLNPPEMDMSMADRLAYLVNAQLQPQPRQRHERLFKILRQHGQRPPFVQANDHVINEIALRELDVIIGSRQGHRDHTIARRINHTLTHVGFAALCRHLVQVKQPDQLRALQNAIQGCGGQRLQRIRAALQAIAPTEDTFLSFWVSTTPGMRDYLEDILEHEQYKSLPFGLNDWANRNDVVIELTQFGRFVAPGINPIASLVSLGFAIPTANPMLIVPSALYVVNSLWGIPDSITQMNVMIMALYLMQTKLISIAAFIEQMGVLRAALQGQGLPQSLMNDLSLPTATPEMQQLQELLQTNTFRGTGSFFSHWGRICVAYRLMLAKKDEFIRAYAALGNIDFLASQARLLTLSTQEAPYCFAQYEGDCADAGIVVENGWSPLLDRATVVTNNVTLGAGSPRTHIITGPNARGKTTTARSVAAAAIGASTIGTGFGSRVQVPANLDVLTSMNISDDPARNLSLFQAAVKRMAQVLLTMRAQPQRPCLVITDEPFVGTRQDVANATALRFITAMGQQLNALAMVTSHLASVSGLSQQHQDLFANYHVAAGYRYMLGIDADAEEYDNVAMNIINDALGGDNDFVAGVRANMEDARQRQQQADIAAALGVVNGAGSSPL